MGLTLRQSLFRLLFFSIVVTAIVILINVWTATSKLVEGQLQERLLIASNVFERFQRERQSDLIRSATVLAADFGFKQAVATNDIPTINSALLNQSNRINADVMAIFDLQGVLQTSQPASAIDAQFPYPQLVDLALRGTVSQAIDIIDQQAFQMILLPVKAPTVKGALLIGFNIDSDYLSDVKAVIQADLISYEKDASGSPELLASTLAPSTASRILSKRGESLTWAEVTFSSDIPYVSRDLMLSTTKDNEIHLTIAADVTNQYRSFNYLQFSVITISVIAILVSLVITLLVSRRITQPLSSLIEGVKHIAAGDYGQSLDVSGKLQEIKHLGHAFATMQESIASREKHIRFQSEHDNLTNLFNRNYMKHAIDAKIASGAHIQVIGINLIGFRQINDLYGYQNGDECLKRLSERLTRWPGEAARLAGSNMYWVPDSPLDEIKLETLRFILEQPIETNGLSIPIRISLGVMDLPEDAADAEHLFRRMNIVKDEALSTKQWFVRYTSELEKRYLRRLDIVTELKRTLLQEKSDLSMVYQPKVNLKTNKVAGLEALIRWNSSVLGFVPPDEFIPIAEQAGLIEAVTEYVMGQVIFDVSRIKKQGYDISVAINLSSQDIENTELITRFLDRLEFSGLTSADVELEMTESDFVADQSRALENLHSLRTSGFNVAIDDFGTGYSSLAYLKNLPVDTLKIDKSFVMNLAKNHDDQQIVNIVLQLAYSFNLKVVAEGVEDEIAMMLLREWGCNLAQGYFISRPLQYDALIDWFNTCDYF
jgi:diguanylate cyclase (GGDEF)-like protein